MNKLNSLKTTVLVASLTIPQLLFQLPANANQWDKNTLIVACSTYETNKFDKKREVEAGGWTPGWADDISETDVGLGLVAAGVSIYTGNSGAFALWVENLVQRTVNSLGASLSRNAKAEATRVARQIIFDAIAGESGKEIVKQFDTFDFKAGAIRYSGRNREPLFCNTISTTWGMKPYVMIRVRSSAKPDENPISCNTNGRATPNGQNRGDRLVSHTEMYEGDYLLSGDRRFKLVMQGDGNLVIYKHGQAIWASNTNGVDCTPYKLAMQSDGNLVIYGKSRPIWASNTNGNGSHPFSLVMQNDGNLVIYDPSRPTWASDTCCH